MPPRRPVEKGSGMMACAVVVFIGVVLMLFAVAFVYPRMIH